MANDMITLTHANCTATCTTHPALLLAPQLPMHVQNNCKNTRHCWQNSTRYRNGVKVFQCHSPVSLCVLVFIKRKPIFVWLILPYILVHSSIR